ncbi:MAG: ABC transporter substrate-binding protein, partial [Nitrososphaerales archaeon]
VLCIEWLDPIFTAGHWVPQMVELTGAVNGVSKRREPSRRMEWEEALEFDSDIIVLMPCGFDTERTMKELWRIEKQEEWKHLRAVKNKMVYATDASSYFSRPGPRTVTGLEILAKIIHPDLFRDLNVPEGSFSRVY